MTNSVFVGVDGCRHGWFSVVLDENGGLAAYGVHKTFDDLLAHYASACLVLVDIPIGLPDCPGGRACDTQARKKLGRGRQSSVFSAPTRLALERAISAGGYDDPSYRAGGKRLSQQTFNIAQKIAQVDTALHLRGAGARPKVREVHPEICFWALTSSNESKRHAMLNTKKKAVGKEERLRVLEETPLPSPRNVYCRLVSEVKASGERVGKDDILDALAAAVTGWLAAVGKGKLATLPAKPQYDALGLPMEMVYCVPDPR